jgi:hypothetical protein
MSDPWKVVICDSDQCMSEMFVPENMKAEDNSLNAEALEKYKIYPDIDNETVTQFTCRRCSKVTTWGPTRRGIAEQLHERYS